MTTTFSLPTKPLLLHLLLPLILPLLLLLLPPEATPSRVIELSDRFLDIVKNTDSNGGDGYAWLVMFYAPWCGHCKKLEPIYGHVAQALHDAPVRVGRIDGTRFGGVVKEFEISGYPTILFFPPGAPPPKTTKKIPHYPYNGPRTAPSISLWTRRLLRSPVVMEIDCGKNYGDSLLDEEPVAAIFHHGGDIKNGDEWTEFEMAANSGRLRGALGWFVCKESDSDPTPFVELLVKNTPLETTPTTTTTPMETKRRTYRFHDNNPLSQWVWRERWPLFFEIGKERAGWGEVLESGGVVILGVVAADKLGRVTDPNELGFLEALGGVARRWDILGGAAQFVWTGVPDLGNEIAMTTLQLPALLVVNGTAYEHHLMGKEEESDFQDGGGEISMETKIEKWLRSVVVEKRIEPTSRPSPWTTLYRTYYQGTTQLALMFHGNPVLTTLLFGLPLAFLSLICYSICCYDEEDDSIPLPSDDEDYYDHEKKE